MILNPQLVQELIELVSKVREAQKEYFRTKSGIALNESKKLEKELDKILTDFGYPKDKSFDNQSKLF